MTTALLLLASLSTSAQDIGFKAHLKEVSGTIALSRGDIAGGTIYGYSGANSVYDRVEAGGAYRLYLPEGTWRLRANLWVTRADMSGRSYLWQNLGTVEVP